MQNLRYRNLIKILRWSINLMLYAEIVTALVAIGLIAVTINSDEKLISGWSAITPDKAIEQTIEYDTQLESAIVETRELNIQFSANNFTYYFLKFIETIIILSLIIFITVLLGKIISSLYKDHPFSIENAKRLKGIAILIMAFTPYSLIQSLVYRSYISNHIFIEGKTFVYSLFPGALMDNEIWLNFEINLYFLLVGILLLVLAEIFRIGVLLKTDSESII